MRKSRSTPGYDAWAKKSRKRRRKLRWGRILLLLLIGGSIMISLGIIGYYISKIFEEVKGRPQYIVSRECGPKE